MTIYGFKAIDIKGTEVNLSEYQGKVLLIVNTATGCGFTPQYKGLEELYEKYHEQGFEILDFPCNQFAHQAPGSEEEIAIFCQLRFGVTFKQFAKIEVNGKNTHPLYQYLKEQKSGTMGERIKWNFTKFLIDRSGNVIERYGSAVKPEKIEDKIKELLEKK